MFNRISNYNFIDILISILTIYIYPDNSFIKNLFIQDSLIISSFLFYNNFVCNNKSFSSSDIYKFNWFEKLFFYLSMNMFVSLLYTINLLPVAINFLLLLCTPTVLNLVTKSFIYNKIKNLLLYEFNDLFIPHYVNIINEVCRTKFIDIKFTKDEIIKNCDTLKLFYYYMYYFINVSLTFIYNINGFKNRICKVNPSCDDKITELVYSKKYEYLYNIDIYDYLIDKFIDNSELYKNMIQTTIIDLITNYIQFLLFYSISHYSIILTLLLYYGFASYKLLKENQTITSFVLVHLLYVLRFNFIASCYLILPFEINDNTINIVDIKEYVFINFINDKPLLVNLLSMKEKYINKEYINNIVNLNYDDTIYMLFGNNKNIIYSYVLLYCLTSNWIGHSLIHIF